MTPYSTVAKIDDIETLKLMVKLDAAAYEGAVQDIRAVATLMHSYRRQK
jgi:hypothetical protein